MFNRPIPFLLALIAIAMGVTAFERLSARKAEPVPAFRQSLEYDKCLARGRTVIACDAEARVLAAEREEIKRRDPFAFYGEVAPTAVPPPSNENTDWQRAITDTRHQTYELPKSQ